MKFDLSVRIRRPPAVVFALLADIQGYATHADSPVREMEKRPPGATRVGTVWREVVRLAPGVSMTVWSEVTDLQPDGLLAMTFHGPGMVGELTYTLTPVEEGTLLRQRETLRATGPARPFAWLIRRMLAPRLGSRLEDIRVLLERGRV